MISFDLRCTAGHVFEAWFGSSPAYEAQVATGQVRCPVCDDASVGKALMAPNIGGKANRLQSRTPAEAKAALKTLAAAQAKALASSTWVGTAFAERARAMHDGVESPATIHGQASAAEARALVEDGVPVMPLPLPIVSPGTRH